MGYSVSQFTMLNSSTSFFHWLFVTHNPSYWVSYLTSPSELFVITDLCTIPHFRKSYLILVLWPISLWEMSYIIYTSKIDKKENEGKCIGIFLCIPSIIFCPSFKCRYIQQIDRVPGLIFQWQIFFRPKTELTWIKSEL